MHISSSSLIRIMVSPIDNLNTHGDDAAVKSYVKLFADPSSDDSGEANFTQIVYTLDVRLSEGEWMAAGTAQVVLDITGEIGDVRGDVANKRFSALSAEFKDFAMPVLWLAVAPSMAATIAMIPRAKLKSLRTVWRSIFYRLTSRNLSVRTGKPKITEAPIRPHHRLRSIT
ncbi:hypothetical protein EJ997_10100 [Flaviflexus ciconiae]|uniref:Uncharacterized protein n=1 Tax=Flaviflexus ciconiae TaxID=2496867 RepID=A0A3Q9G531_9ACTO|nr:hypothetical protein EJ997_10100 [Flaviflexus ciconiae]